MTVRSRSRQLLVLFLALVVPAAGALVWLGVRLLEQDREIFARRDLERQEAAADAAVRVLSQLVVDAERQLSEGRRPNGAIPLRKGRAPAEPRDDVFMAAERQEFSGDSGAALSRYLALAKSADPSTRAGALVRIARIHRARHAWPAALGAYRALARIENVGIDGMPADLLARRAACDVLQAAGLDAKADVASLSRDLAAGRWTLDLTAWELTVTHLQRLGTDPNGLPEQRSLAMAGDWFGRTPLRGAGRQALMLDGRIVTVFWHQRGEETAGFALPEAVLQEWSRSVVDRYPPDTLHLGIGVDATGSGGGIGRSASRVGRRTVAETGLPWNVALTPGPRWQSGAEFASRRRLLLAGLAALALLLGAGTYLLWHLLRRELAIARLHADFVSAVSHEFRTPLTSLRHVVDLLEEDDDLSPGSRRSYYAVLGRSTDRLQRLVESLLDFGRMEEGRRPYELQEVDAVQLVTRIASEFERDAAAGGRAIEIGHADVTRQTVRADAAALGHAVWNLLDNAVKYSPQGGRVRISVEPRGPHVAIAVEDEGVGVPDSERSEILLKFVRGSTAKALGIKGTGVGLAIVSHIVDAHGGAVEIESEEGRGSTFTLVLPAP